MDAVLSALDTWARQLSQASEVEIALVWRGTGDPQRHLGDAAVSSCGLVVGSPAQVRLTPRDVFGPAVEAGSDWVVIAHTHLTDSGPSESDHAVTRRLVAAGVVLGTPLLAHLLVEPSGTTDLVSGRRVRQKSPAA